MAFDAVTSAFRTMDSQTSYMAALALLCAVLPLELSHLAAAVVGAVAYVLLLGLQPSVPRRGEKTLAEKAPTCTAQAPRHSGGRGCCAYLPAHRRRGVVRAGAAKPEPAKPPVRRPSILPVVAPTFQKAGWGEQVEELLSRIRATPEGEATVREIALAVQQAIRPVLPDAEVVGFARGSLKSGAAFGVAVPDVDIVINANQKALAQRLLSRWSQGKVDVKKLHKSAIRACTDRLVSEADFRFRRSAFRNAEPKVMLIAPCSVPGLDTGVPINLFVNAKQPLQLSALLAECGRLDRRAEELILLAKRWAKDRGLSHETKGHLSPLAWALLVVYFLQVGAGEDEPLLPPVAEFKVSSGLSPGGAVGDGAAAADLRRPPASGSVTSAELFRRFVRFYAQGFDWRNEAVSARLGRRGAPDLSLPLHIIVNEDGSTVVGPSIEDPFDEASNLGDCMCAQSLVRLREEFARAHALSSPESPSLADLLEPWAPPLDEEAQEQ